MTSKFSIQDGIRSHQENVLEGLYRNRWQGSEHNLTVFAMYNQELSRDRVAPSSQKLRSMVRQHIKRQGHEISKPGMK